MNNVVPRAVRLESSFAYLVYRSARLLRYDFACLMAERGLEATQEQWFILNKLAEQPGQSQTELCDGVFIDRPNLTRMLMTMERNGLLHRDSDRDDGRKLLVSLTAKGIALHARIRDAVLARRERLFDGLTQKDLQQLRHVLSTLEANITSMRDAQNADGKEPGRPSAPSRKGAASQSSDADE
ncbi:MAG TPA: MarR family transcriptional regulator [Polyangiaceae bacterium]|nr:MarR family transcriptional regulator [Polyangiaceae bacterium]